MKRELSQAVFWLILIGLCCVGWFSLPTISHPLGSDWGHYFTAAEFIWDPSPGVAYPDFRKPWFGWLLGGLGQVMGYLAAAQLIGKASLLITVCSAVLLGSALVSRWAGLAAGATVVMMPLAMDGALWVNHYPLLGGAVGLAFAAGAAASRWSGLGWVVLAGLSAGISLALDARGAVAVPSVAVLVFIGTQGLGASGLVKRLIILFLCVGSISAHDAWLQDAFSVPQLPFEQQLQVQRKGTLEQIRQGIVGDDLVRQACADETLTPFSIAMAWSPCGEALRASSASRLAGLKLIPGAALSLWAMLCLLPAAWTRRGMLRSSAATAVVFGAPAVSLLVGMAWVTYFDRYVLPFAAIIASVGAVAVGRALPWCLRWLPMRFHGFSGPLAATVALVIAASVWPGRTARDLDAPEHVRSSEYHAGVFAQWARAELSEKDSVIDCAGLAIDSLLLPKRVDYVRFPPGDPECVSLVKWPPSREGLTYLITMHRDLPTSARITDLPFNVAAVQALGWVDVTEDLEVEGYRLWGRR